MGVGRAQKVIRVQSAGLYRAGAGAFQSLNRCAAPMRPLAAAVLLAAFSAGCSVSFPILGLSSKSEDEIAATSAMTTSSVLPARGGDRLSLPRP